MAKVIDCKHRWGRWSHYDYYEGYGRTCTRCQALQVLNGPLMPVGITHEDSKVCPLRDYPDMTYKGHDYGLWGWREDLGEWEQACNLMGCNKKNKRRAKALRPWSYGELRIVSGGQGN